MARIVAGMAGERLDKARPRSATGFILASIQAYGNACESQVRRLFRKIYYTFPGVEVPPSRTNCRALDGDGLEVDSRQTTGGTRFFGRCPAEVFHEVYGDPWISLSVASLVSSTPATARRWCDGTGECMGG